MTKLDNIDELSLLRDVLDRHGADSARWPVALQQRLTDLLRRSPEARRQVEEEAALDRILRLAPATTPKAAITLANSIADRIAASQGADELARRSQIAPGGGRPAPEMRHGARAHWPAAAALAACLLVGFVIGTSGLGGDAIDSVIGWTADSQSAATATDDLALGDPGTLDGGVL